MATLYQYYDCPYCLRVRAYLAERELAHVANWVVRDLPPPELLSLNPLGTLPIYVTDAGKPIFGSLTIVEFIEGSLGPALIPADPLQKARVAMAEQICNAALLEPLLKLDRAMSGRDPDQWDLQVVRQEGHRVQRALAVFAALLGQRQWLVGDSLTYADLCLAQPLSILERYGIDLQAHAGLKDLAERLWRRPSLVSARKSPEHNVDSRA